MVLLLLLAWIVNGANFINVLYFTNLWLSEIILVGNVSHTGSFTFFESIE